MTGKTTGVLRVLAVGLVALSAAALAGRRPAGAAAAMVEWPFQAGDPGSTHYSPLADINRLNVSRMALAWEWKTAEEPLEQFGVRPGMFEATPLMIDNVLYLSTPYHRVVALDAESGAELWSYDPKSYEDGQPPNGTGYVHRGIASWRDGGSMRIFLNTRYRLIALDAKTGKPIDSFGEHGIVDLSNGLIWKIN